MFASLLAGIGLPVLTKLVGYALGKLTHPLAKAASEALDKIGGAIDKGEVPPEALNEANRHLEAMAEIEAGREAVALTEINRTMRREVLSDDPYVRRMRPTFGYIIAATWLGQMGAVAYLIALKPAFAVEVIGALNNLSTSWSVALGVLGIYVYKRSQDKNGGSLFDSSERFPTNNLTRLAEKFLGRGEDARTIASPPSLSRPFPSGPESSGTRSLPRDPYAERSTMR